MTRAFAAMLVLVWGGLAQAASWRTVVLVESSAPPEVTGRLHEALQVYLRDFGAVARALPPEPDPVAAIAARAEADFVVVLRWPGGENAQVSVNDLRPGAGPPQTTPLEVPAGLGDPTRHLALSVRGELAAAARTPVSAPPAPLPRPSPRGLAAGVGSSAALTPSAAMGLRAAALAGWTMPRRFLGGVIELGREGSRPGELGRAETWAAGLGVDVRPGALAVGERWRLLWGGQLGVTWTRTDLVGRETGTRLRVSDTFHIFVRPGLLGWHPVAGPLYLVWEAGAEVLPRATQVKVGRDAALDTGHVRPRASVALAVQL